VNLKNVRPMLVSSAPTLPEGDQWSYEMKWDGYRTLAVKDGARVTLCSRNLKDATAQYSTAVRAVAEIRETSALLALGHTEDRRGGVVRRVDARWAVVPSRVCWRARGQATNGDPANER
jgi:ATP dependent DNA ligase domain